MCRRSWSGLGSNERGKPQHAVDTLTKTQRVHVPNNWVLGIWVILIIVQVLGKYMIIRYLDPYKKFCKNIVDYDMMVSKEQHTQVPVEI